MIKKVAEIRNIISYDGMKHGTRKIVEGLYLNPYKKIDYYETEVHLERKGYEIIGDFTKKQVVSHLVINDKTLLFKFEE